MKAITNIDKTTIRVKGQEVNVNSLKIFDQELIINGCYLKTCSLKDEWYQDFNGVERFIDTLMSTRIPADIFTFIDRPPACTPNYSYHTERDNVAAITLTTYEDWWKKKINSSTRAVVRKAEKSGVYVKLANFDDVLLQGIKEIYDETPIRQIFSVSSVAPSAWGESWSLSSAPSNRINR